MCSFWSVPCWMATQLVDRNCCRCNGTTGRCRNCSCVKAGTHCLSCLPGHLGHCGNQPSQPMSSSQPLSSTTTSTSVPGQALDSQLLPPSTTTDNTNAPVNQNVVDLSSVMHLSHDFYHLPYQLPGLFLRLLPRIRVGVFATSPLHPLWQVQTLLGEAVALTPSSTHSMMYTVSGCRSSSSCRREML